MSDVTGAFGRLLAFHHEVGSRLPDVLEPPASEEQLARAQERFGMELHPDVVALYGFADGMDIVRWWRERQVPPWVIPDAEFPGLNESVKAAERLRAAAGEMREVWQPSWFPVLHLHPAEVLVVDCADDEGEVWLVRWEATDIGVAAPNLAALLDHATQRMRDVGVTAGDGGAMAWWFQRQRLTPTSTSKSCWASAVATRLPGCAAYFCAPCDFTVHEENLPGRFAARTWAATMVLLYVAADRITMPTGSPHPSCR